MNPSHRRFYAFTATALALFTLGCLVILFAFVPRWQQQPPAEFIQWFGQHGKTIGAVMLPLEMIPFVLSLRALVKSRAARNTTGPWVCVNLCNAAILALFVFYFLPVNGAFMNGAMPLPEVPEALHDWQRFHVIRTILSALAVLFSARALTSLRRQQPDPLPLSR
jgi:hypothetical protein